MQKVVDRIAGRSARLRRLTSGLSVLCVHRLACLQQDSQHDDSALVTVELTPCPQCYRVPLLSSTTF